MLFLNTLYLMSCYSTCNKILDNTIIIYNKLNDLEIKLNHLINLPPPPYLPFPPISPPIPLFPPNSPPILLPPELPPILIDINLDKFSINIYIIFIIILIVIIKLIKYICFNQTPLLMN